jgi:hypothetical protein
VLSSVNTLYHGEHPHQGQCCNCGRAKVTEAVVDDVAQLAATANTPIRAGVVTMVAWNVGTDYASLASSTDIEPSMDGRSRTGPSPSHDKATWTPCDAAVGKSVDQPLRSLLQPQQLASRCVQAATRMGLNARGEGSC